MARYKAAARHGKRRIVWTKYGDRNKNGTEAGNMMDELSSSARKVQEVLQIRGLSFRVVELPASTRTAREAAEAIGCQVGQIAKSLVFKGKHSGKPLLVIASGANRVDEAKVAELAGEPIEKADADFVRQRTGFSIGGVPPVGHSVPLQTWIDEDLLQHEAVWAAAGTPHAIFELKPTDLPEMTGGKIAAIT
jgi:prolyl-tRNA editing enzyme YbaK/EbsC (Cys-tRNA(Pro) deacylase)